MRAEAKSKINLFLLELLFSSRILEKIISPYFVVTKKSKYYHLEHLPLYYKGSIQEDESLYIFSLIKLIRPKLVIEFGFGRGLSALNFLRALDDNARLISFDISDQAEYVALKCFSDNKQFKFIKKSQLDVNSEDLDNQKIDLVFIDSAIYDEYLLFSTFKNIMPYLSESALIIVHDTGTWNKKFMDERHFSYAERRKDDWINEYEFQQQKGHRKFINLVLKEYKDAFEVIHLHSQNTLRKGFSIIQRVKLLQTEKSLSS